LESNWRYNRYRYGLTNLWEAPDLVEPVLAGVKRTFPQDNYVLLRTFGHTVATYVVPPVDTTTKRILVVPGSTEPISWVWFLDGDVYKDRPLVLPWQGRIDPIN